MGEATIQTSIWGWRGGSAQNPHRFPSISPSETGQSLRREAQPGWKTAHPPCAAASRSRGPCPAEPRRGGGKRARRAPAGTGRGEAAAAAGVEAGGGGSVRRCSPVRRGGELRWAQQVPWWEAGGGGGRLSRAAGRVGAPGGEVRVQGPRDPDLQLHPCPEIHTTTPPGEKKNKYSGRGRDRSLAAQEGVLARLVLLFCWEGGEAR